MKKYSFICCGIILMQTQFFIANSQSLEGYSFRVVDMIPYAQSNESNFDAETNIAVNPHNVKNIAGSALSPNPSFSSATAPIFVTTNGGTTWAMNNIMPSGNGMTGDISLGFGASSNTLYTGILRGGGTKFREMLLRTNYPANATPMTTLIDKNTLAIDQPFVAATTANDAAGTARDRVFIGANNLSNGISSGGNGRTAETTFSNDATSAVPAGFTTSVLEGRNTSEQDFPGIRTAIHNSGVVYSIFYNWMSGGSTPTNSRCDVIVVRDDNFGTGPAKFRALNDAADAGTGERVVTNVLVPGFGISLGNNRLVGSNLAIAVDPNNSATVYIAWCDRVGTTDYTLHVRRSTNSGQAWGSDLLTITNATNPAIAIAANGRVAVVYQQLTGAGATSQWETHFRSTPSAGTVFSDDLLSVFLDSDLLGSTFSPSLGDYLDMEAVGDNFYGVFPASNRPDNANFPKSVTYQRNANFTTKQIRSLNNTSNVVTSVDPFFFKVYIPTLDICALHPQICTLVKIELTTIHIPPSPCLSCPFIFSFNDIYQLNFRGKEIKTNLSVPYFHLLLEGYDPQNYDIEITSAEGEPITQQLNKTANGYAISFRPSKNAFNLKEGLHGLSIMATPKNEQGAKAGIELNYRLEVSDYRFKEHTNMKR